VRGGSKWVSPVLLSGAVLSGICALEVFGRFFVLAADHVVFARTAGLAWMAVTFLAGSVLLFGSRLPTRLQLLRLAVLLVLVCVTPWAAVKLPAMLQIRPHPVHPNIVLLTCDAMRADYLSAYGGHVETPAMERLAERGARFDRAYAAAPHTGPSLFALVHADYPPTRYPDESITEYYHRLGHMFSLISGRTFAERLADAGYVTAVLNGNEVLTDWSRRGEFLRGLDVSVEIPYPPARHPPWFDWFPFLRSALEAFFPEIGRAWPLDSTRRLTTYARSFIRLNHRKPFFLWVHFMDPHSPYNPPKAFRTGEELLDFWPPDEGERVDWEPDPHLDTFLRKDEEKRIEEARLLYEGEIRYVDHAIGKILSTLNRLGLEGNTYVCLSADHGEEFLDHGSILHGRSYYQEVIRVPLVVAGPTIEGRRVDSVVSLIDLMPTLFHLTHVTPAPEWEGEDFSAMLRGPVNDMEEPRARCAWNNGLGHGSDPAPAARMIVQNGYKLIEEIETGDRLLFNLDADPAEQNDLSKEQPELAERMMRALHETAARAAERWNAAPAAEGSEAASSETQEKLEALGYL
jgi:arylsulfatase A-like enzyme